MNLPDVFLPNFEQTFITYRYDLIFQVNFSINYSYTDLLSIICALQLQYRLIRFLVFEDYHLLNYKRSSPQPYLTILELGDTTSID
jgi:hypothetical protein